MFVKTLKQAEHTRSFFVTAREAEGWEVSIEQDSRVIKRSQYSDWHRLERAVDAIRREIAALEDQGWHGVSSVSR